MTELFIKHFQALVYYGLKFVTDVQVVEDIVVGVFLAYDQKGYKDERVLYLAVKRKCLNHIRDNKKRVQLDESLHDQPVENEIIEIEFLKNLQGCIDKLPPESKKIIYKFYYEGKDHLQIAIETGKPENTVRSAKRYALKVLRGLLTKPTTQK